MGNKVPVSKAGRANAKYSAARAGGISKNLLVLVRIFRISRTEVQIGTLFFEDRLDLGNISLHIWRAGFVPVSSGRVTGLREPSHLNWELDPVFIACKTG